MTLAIHTGLVDDSLDSDTPSFPSIAAAVIYAAYVLNERSADPVGTYEIPLKDVLNADDPDDDIKLTADLVELDPFRDGLYCRHLAVPPVSIDVDFPVGGEGGEALSLAQIIAVGDSRCEECRAYLRLIGSFPPPLPAGLPRV